MDGACWKDDRIIPGTLLKREYNPDAGTWFWYDASGDLSASMFFRLKYLPAEAVCPWLRSVFSIPCPHWRAQILVWFVGAHDILSGGKPDPSHFDPEDWPSLTGTPRTS